MNLKKLSKLFITLALTLSFGTVSYGATIYTTNTTDTIGVFRTNVNSSLTNLNTDVISALASGSFPFTFTSPYVSTTTIVGFLTGMFSNGSSTITSLYVGNSTTTNATTTALATTNLTVTASSSLNTFIANNSTTTNATTTTASFTNASTTNFTISGLLSQLLGTNSSGTVVGSTVSSPLTYSSNTLACPTCNTSSASVTSVGLSLPSFFTVTNSPVTTSGTLTGAISTSGNSFLTTNQAGTNIIATTSLITVSSLTATSSTNFSGFATSTPYGFLSINPTQLMGTAPSFVIGSSTLTHFRIDNGGQILAYDKPTGLSGVISPLRFLVLQTGTTSRPWTGTTTGEYVPTIIAPFRGILEHIRCQATSTQSFINVNPFINVTPTTPSNFVASSTVGTTTFTGTNTFNPGDRIGAYFGSSTPSSNNISITCTLTATETVQ